MSKHHHKNANEDPQTAGAGKPQGENGQPAQEPAAGNGTAPGSAPAGEEQAAPNGTGEAAAQAAPPGEAADPAERIAALESKLAEANDQYLRKAADFENYRKRMIREKQDAVDYANQSLLLDLIQVMDDFERAIKAAETLSQSSPEFKNFYEGVSMIEKRLSSQLENKWGLKRFESAGQPFDPNRHEAMMMDKSAGIKEPVVQEEYYKGYTLKERVVRPAKVKVLMPEEPAASPENGAQAGAELD
ncbi:MAG: nucleotide exchange factor GrpE [Treponema sp.]|jgi:molecular chaperone GrpE|nr:nucleotide exchange factor GrpE [Treponema sp.]